jgi:hypothetical protein
MTMLKVVVIGLHRIDQLVPAVQELGRRHARYGVKDEYYYTVGAALLWALRVGLGDSFTPEVATAWATGDLDIAEDLTINGAGAGQTVIKGGAGWDDRIFDWRQRRSRWQRGPSA